SGDPISLRNSLELIPSQFRTTKPAKMLSFYPRINERSQILPCCESAKPSTFFQNGCLRDWVDICIGVRGRADPTMVPGRPFGRIGTGSWAESEWVGELKSGTRKRKGGQLPLEDVMRYQAQRTKQRGRP